MEAGGPGIFMISASLFAILLFHPTSVVIKTIPDLFLRRTLMGLAMGLTAIGIIFSPWGKQLGAHLNPLVTLTFFRLGKVAPWDAVFYVVAQFGGGLAGILAASGVAGKFLADPAINYVSTVPGSRGAVLAFGGEIVISFILMTIVLAVSNTEKLARFTGLFAGACVAAFITFEAPLSGMSMNPARSFSSTFLPQLWTTLWIYFLAPPMGMLLAAGVHVKLKRPVACAKLHHRNRRRCIFCNYHRLDSL